MKPLDAHLVALDVLEVAASGASVDEVVVKVKPDLEVLPREDLIRVAMAVAVEAVRATPQAQWPGLLRRLGQRRLVVMMDGS